MAKHEVYCECTRVRRHTPREAATEVVIPRHRTYMWWNVIPGEWGVPAIKTIHYYSHIDSANQSQGMARLDNQDGFSSLPFC